jgi:hypothetical protein
MTESRDLPVFWSGRPSPESVTVPAARPRPAGRIQGRGTRAIRAHGRWSGHVDLGRLGIADRWADLAIATRSAGWNYGPGWERLLLDAYGVEPDPERTRYYGLLWDLG